MSFKHEVNIYVMPKNMLYMLYPHSKETFCSKQERGNSSEFPGRDDPVLCTPSQRVAQGESERAEGGGWQLSAWFILCGISSEEHWGHFKISISNLLEAVFIFLFFTFRRSCSVFMAEPGLCSLTIKKLKLLRAL